MHAVRVVTLICEYNAYPDNRPDINQIKMHADYGRYKPINILVKLTTLWK